MTSIKRLFLTSLSTVLLATPALATPALAVGQITVEDAEGEVDIYSNVKITHTADTLYLKAPDSETTLVINKKNCTMEKSIQVCSTGDVTVSTYGVDESLEVDKMFIFINSTKERQVLEGSKVVLSPSTVLIEILTTKGTYINGMGQIDSMQKP